MERISCLLALFLLVSVGCVSTISKELQKEVSSDLTFGEVIKNPEARQGKIVIFSGIILGAKNTKEGTLIEILQKPKDREGRPRDVDESEGRFLALNDGYLDVAIYSRGREVSVAGVIEGKRVLPLGEIEYTYPLISIKEIHLFKIKKERELNPYPYPYWWRYPWWHSYGFPW